MSTAASSTHGTRLTLGVLVAEGCSSEISHADAAFGASVDKDVAVGWVESTQLSAHARRAAAVWAASTARHTTLKTAGGAAQGQHSQYSLCGGDDF